MPFLDSSIDFPGQTSLLKPLMLALVLTFAVWLLYYRELRSRFGKMVSATLPLMRCAAIMIIATTLFEPRLNQQNATGEAPTLSIVVDSSTSMSLPSSVRRSNATTRAGQALNAIFGKAGIVARLGNRFNIFVSITDLASPIEWQHNAGESATQLAVPSWDSSSPKSTLGQAVTRQLESSFSTKKPGIVLLLSDGRNNAGIGLLEAAERCQTSGVALFTLGFGPTQRVDDLAVLAVEGPPKLGRQETFRGKARIREEIPEGTGYTVQVQFENHTLWERRFTSQALPEKEIGFAITAEEMLEHAVAADSAQVNSLAIKLDIVVKLNGDEDVDAVKQNNRKPLFTQVAVRKRKLLLIDGRHRWESRYIYNLFHRDSSWEVTKLIANPADQELTNVPSTKEELSQYHCVVIGEIPEKLLPIEFCNQLVDFVSEGVGGVGFIDGARGHWHNQDSEKLHQLFPVKWEPLLETKVDQTFEIEILPPAEQLGIPDLFDNSDAELKLLPSVDFVARSEVQLGAETLLQAKTNYEVRPLLVTRQFGAGKVFYLATDQTWKWRFDDSQKIHENFWSQVINAVASVPYSLQSQSVELETGSPSYRPGEEIQIRAKLRDTSGEAATNQQLFARLKNAAGEIKEVLLSESLQQPGNYSVVLRDLPPDNYSVELLSEMIPNTGSKLTSKFSVIEEENLEFTSLTQAQDILQQASSISEGQYFPASQWSDLVEALHPLSNYQIERRSYSLWDTAFWFAAAMLLIAADWLARKKVGLV